MTSSEPLDETDLLVKEYVDRFGLEAWSDQALKWACDNQLNREFEQALRQALKDNKPVDWSALVRSWQG